MKYIFYSSLPLLLLGCGGISPEDSVDPYEDMNRTVFAFNQQFDRYVFNPVVSTYQYTVPHPFRVAIHNFYFNVAELAYATNFLLQGDFENGYRATVRVVVNSTFGCGGIFDLAADLGIERKKNDFGKTLYLAGYTDSAYYVAPFFGPMTIRDSYGMFVDKVLLSPLTYINNTDYRNELFLMNLIDTKSNLSDYLQKLTTLPYVEDQYTFVRDSYLQYRSYQLTNGRMDWDSFYDHDENEDSDEHESESNKEFVKTK